MIGLDTNVLARYYIEDSGDTQSVKQREIARRIIESGKPLKVALTVLLELEWVMRGYYRFSAADITTCFAHLLSLPNTTIERRDAVTAALEGQAEGLDFADALHHACYSDCEFMMTFDDRKFARRAKRLALIPPVQVPGK